jgi:hypothetical protein
MENIFYINTEKKTPENSLFLLWCCVFDVLAVMGKFLCGKAAFYQSGSHDNQLRGFNRLISG